MPVKSSDKKRVLIIGAGVLGLSTAWFIRRISDCEITVLDREPISQSASCGNAGLICFGHPPLTRPGVSVQGLKWMLKSDSPLYIKPRLDRKLFSWLWTFHRHCNKKHFEASMHVLCELARLSADCFETMLETEATTSTPINCDWRRDGWDDICLHEKTLNHAEHESKLLNAFGYTSERITGAELQRESGIFTNKLAGAIRYHDSATLDPRAFMQELAHSLEHNHGVKFRTNATVATLRQDAASEKTIGVTLDTGETIEADATILTAGVWSDALAATTGLAIPMQPARGYHRDLTGLKHMPPRGCVLNETMIAVSPFHGTLRLAGTLELAGYNAPPIQARLNNLTHAASNYFNGLETNATTNIKEDWHGYRPCTPDGMPAIGAVTKANKETNLYIGTGHAMLGMTLGPASGKLIAQAVLGDTQSAQNGGLCNSPLLSPMRFQ